LLAPTLAPAQAFSVLHSFTNSADGGQPLAGLILISNTLYGTTFQGGTNGNGLVYALNTDGSGYRILHQFSQLFSIQGSGEHPTNSDGASPRGGLSCLGNTLFGTTSQGGFNENGTLFSLNLGGTNFSTVYSFVGPTQSWQGLDSPIGDQVPVGSTFYGTTSLGYDSLGGVYSVDTNGNFNPIYSFTDRIANGDGPTGGLALLGNALYGMTVSGGSQGNGNIITVLTNGSAFTELYSFPTYAWDSAIGVGTNFNGYNPVGQLVAVGNKLFGMTEYGGINGVGTLFSINSDGSGFTVLHAFSAPGTSNTNIDGANPLTDLIAVGTKLYGSTPYGGANGNGVVFSLNTDGSQFTVLRHMNGSVDGYAPNKLLFSGNRLYGTTRGGGLYNSGTVFSLPVASQAVLISGAILTSDGSFTMDFSGVPNSTNLIQMATNLVPAMAWQTIATNVADGNGYWRMTNSNVYRYSQQYYRAVTSSN
jgi:uncharacterized repeat protein (TIGR03803 family)